MEQKHTITDSLLLYFSFIIYSFVSVSAKMASSKDSIYEALLFFGLELFLLGIYAIIWQQVLKRFPVIMAVSSKGITVVFALIWAILLFHEDITFFNIVGAAMIIIGIVMVSNDE